MGSNTHSTPIEEKRCMYRVHEQLRDENEKAYKPVLLAIGPYNNKNKVGNGFMIEYKFLYIQQMLSRTNGSEVAYITGLKKLEKRARNCYGEHIRQSSENFVKMMLLDGCFIIELFRQFAKVIQREPFSEPIFQMKWVLPRIARDLLLFENQLPFFVLAKLFEMSEMGNNTLLHNSSDIDHDEEDGNLGEHVVDIVEEEEEDGVINVESSTSTADQIILTQLSNLALKFFSAFLPFSWNVNASSYNSIEKIKHLLCLAHEALAPLSLTPIPQMVALRFKFGFRFENAEFEHLLGLIHTTICISILDSEIDNARESQEAEVALKNAAIFKRLFHPIREALTLLLAEEAYPSEIDRQCGFPVNITHDDWKPIPYGSDLRKAGVDLEMAKKFRDDIYKTISWRNTIPYSMEIRKAGIEFEKALKFKELYDRRINRNSNQRSGPCESESETGTQMDGVVGLIVEKLKHLLCLDKIENWESIPFGKEFQEAGVEFNKAKKFKRLVALREIEDWNIHGATELAEAGIKFKKSNKSDSTFFIKFNNINGLMEISPLTIKNHTETYLRNLMAYEEYCGGSETVKCVSSYVFFIDNLINTPKDVELLRRRGVIQNYLGDDEITSTMVNKLCHNIECPTRQSIYARTCRDVNMHCKTDWNVWMAKLRRDYFNSPWAWISFLAAAFLLGLTIVQTVFSIIP